MGSYYKSLIFFMSEDKKDEKKEDQKVEKTIEVLAKQLNISVDNINKVVYGISNKERHEVEKNSDQITSTINKIISSTEMGTNGNLMDTFTNMIDKDSKDEKFVDIVNMLKNRQDVGDIKNIFLNLNNSKELAKYDDLKIVSKIIPQLNDALDAICDSMLSPDDVTKQINKIFKLKTNESENCTEFYDSLNDIISKYDADRFIKKICKDTLIMGKQYVSLVPFSKALPEIYENNKKFYLSENYGKYDELNDTILNESATNILKDYDEKDSIVDLREEMKEFVNSIDISIGSSNLVNQLSLNETYKFSNAYPTDKQLKNVKDSTGSIKTNITTNDGLMNTDTKTQPNSKLKGCIQKILDIKRVIPLKTNDVIFGYYYVEDADTFKSLKSGKSNNFLQRNNIKNLLKNNKDKNIMEDIYDKMSEFIVKKIDPSYIEKHPELREDVYNMLKANELQKGSKITFLYPHEVIEFSINDGCSVLENVLYFAKLYLAVLLSNIMAKISRSADRKVYYIKQGVSPIIEQGVHLAIDELKRGQVSLLTLNNIPNILSYVSNNMDMYVPTDSNGNKPIDFDIMQGQDTQIKDELLETLEQIIVDGTGVPQPIVSASNEMDFARAYTQLNIKFLKRILSFQLDFNKPYTDYIKGLSSTEMSDDSDLNKLKVLLVSLQAPVALMISSTLEQLGNAKDLAQAISELLLGQSNSDDKLFDRLFLDVVKQHTPNINWSMYENMVKNIKLDLIKEKSNEDEEVS